MMDIFLEDIARTDWIFLCGLTNRVFPLDVCVPLFEHWTHTSSSSTSLLLQSIILE
jgi:hypothetical protein